MACAVHMHKSAYNAQSISVLLIINEQEKHSISCIATFVLAALCKQDNHQLCVVLILFVQSFDLSMFLSNYTNSECVFECVLIIRNGTTFVEQRHRLLFNFKVVDRLKLLLGKSNEKNPFKSKEASFCLNYTHWKKHFGQKSKYVLEIYLQHVHTTERRKCSFRFFCLQLRRDLTSNTVYR